MASVKSTIAVNRIDGAGDRLQLSQRASGEVHVIMGPMFAGKTTSLLRRIKSEGSNGRYG